ncbi:FRG domain-containing protein [Bradyrhizobium sp. AZCC 1721]
MANLLGNISIRNAEIAKDPHGQEVLHVRDPHALIQAAGYLKFTRGKKNEAIYFRGQSETYSTLTPSLFRGIGPNQSAQSKRVMEQNRFIAEIVGKADIFSRFPQFAHEPLLQHYGLSTTWIDLVDNIWVALWFASHEAHVSGKQSQYLHFEKRMPATDHEFAYILLVAADSSQAGPPGLFKGTETELVDLRVACPSIFLRPHAQHGVLFRRRGKGNLRPTDYSDQIRGVIRMRLSDALSWLGEAKTLGIHTLFPPPYYDQGYKILLDGRFENSRKVGSILIVGA